MRHLLVASIQRGAWTLAPHERRVRVTACPGAADELKPENATRFAEEPFVILVENRDSDGAFVKRVVRELDKSLHRLWRRPGDPIRFDSLGGAGQMPEEVERRTQGKPYRPRLVAIIDSDRKGPNDTDSPAAQALYRQCEKRSVPCCILAKREAENYLPRILLDERQDVGADHARLVEAWDRLNNDQKNFFDMKNGFEDGVANAVYDALGIGIPHHVQSFFARLREFAIMRDREQVTMLDVPEVYCTGLLGASGQNDLAHYETRLRDGLDDESYPIAMQILAEAATQEVFAPDARRHLESMYSTIVDDAAGRIADALDVLVHDGYIDAGDGGYRFQSNLLKDWWSARFRDHHRPLVEPESRT